jgi:hypothetical protein
MQRSLCAEAHDCAERTVPSAIGTRKSRDLALISLLAHFISLDLFLFAFAAGNSGSSPCLKRPS